MPQLVFIDTEIDFKTHRILDIGGITDTGQTFHTGSERDFARFMMGSTFVVGHNILHHDLHYIRQAVDDAGVDLTNCIDTLFLSPLLFPARPYHALLKDDKLQTEELNNPLNDSIKARDLFYDEVNAFHALPDDLKEVFYFLLRETVEFRAFFRYIDYEPTAWNTEEIIRKAFAAGICANADLAGSIARHPIALAYCLALINCPDRGSITPLWVLKNFPDTERIFFLLRNRPCVTGCWYCNQAHDIYRGLKAWFGFDRYRTYGDEPLQERAVKAAVANKSLLAVFPTGGGKSITFQVPALMAGESAKGLTVVISPLQSLMKDQVDNLEKSGITNAVTINGLLDPIERQKSFERVADGWASLLYISPEALRSRTIEHLLLGRKIVRFVIDEAHCFSSWGHDFRVDYLFIGDFLRSLQEQKQLDEPIPVSCFTATAKRNVIEDIRGYFKEKLNLELELFTSRVSRTNLTYKVLAKANNQEKYAAVRGLIEDKACPTIIYVSRTQKAYKLAESLTKDGFNAKPYHGKMDAKEKSENQEAFIAGEVQIMVATSAFGMGVDKKDVRLVIHYEISDSLENYIQEAGRAGRDEKITADCYVLYDDEDLGKHFVLLNQTRLSIKEIQQIWKAIKNLTTRTRSSVCSSALEIARQAGWDDNITNIETRVSTAISALQEAGYLERRQNMPRVFANSILAKTATEAINKINASTRFDVKQKEKGVRIITKLISSKSRKQISSETPESRVDHISFDLGIPIREVIEIISLLREEGILNDSKDLQAYVKRGDHKNRSLAELEKYARLENFLLPRLEERQKTIHLKEWNELAAEAGCPGTSPAMILTVLNFWAIKGWATRKRHAASQNYLNVFLAERRETLKERQSKRHELARFIVEFLYGRSLSDIAEDEKPEILVEFSVHELKRAYDQTNQLFATTTTIGEIEDALFYLSRMGAIKIEGGFLVIYNRLKIDRLELDNKRNYKKDDYQQLNRFYENKIQQIHIVGEYAKKMTEDYRAALQFVDDYFQLNYGSFLDKYFPGSTRQNEIKRSLTPAKFRQLFGELSPSQLEIIRDNRQKIVVAAGPGSGKTRVLVHKLAALLLMEEVKHDQLLMLTFSRAAATVFKAKLIGLIGKAAHFVEIKTFHSYCFDLLGRVGSLEKSDRILKDTVERIMSNEVESNRITKVVLVIDEAQDMDADEFALIKALMHRNDEMRVIAVGDDDQNIYTFRAADSAHLEQLAGQDDAVKHELIENYRSKSNLVAFANGFVATIHRRMKAMPIIAHQRDNGTIRIVQYDSRNLVLPLVNDVLSGSLSGTVGILTPKNDEARLVTGLLRKRGKAARLVQGNDTFQLYQLAEIRFFLDQLKTEKGAATIDDERWAEAKHAIGREFARSELLEVCQNLVVAFEKVNPLVKYRSDFETFIRESKLEDFTEAVGETILVSTIHKAKGREFDHIFLLLDNFGAAEDDKKRQLYVGLTRAKSQLTIHTNGHHFDSIHADGVERMTDGKSYDPPNLLMLQLTLKDVVLDHFLYRQHRVSRLVSGDRLLWQEDTCVDATGQVIVSFSKKFREELESWKRKGFLVKEVSVHLVCFWTKEESGEEVKVVLPQLELERSTPAPPPLK